MGIYIIVLGDYSREPTSIIFFIYLQSLRFQFIFCFTFFFVNKNYDLLKHFMFLKAAKSSLKKWHKAMESRVHYAVEYAVKRGWLIYGDTYVTLQRGSEDSAFCDCVRIWTVSISKKALVELVITIYLLIFQLI